MVSAMLLEWTTFHHVLRVDGNRNESDHSYSGAPPAYLTCGG